MKNKIFISFLCVLMGFLMVSCAALKNKLKDKNNLTGPGAKDISSKDIDSDSKGSDDGSIDGLSTVYFDYDSSTLNSQAKNALRANLAWLNEQAKVTKLELEGHCDTMGSEAYNIGLGRRRASTVKDFLMAEGLKQPVSIVSYGEERPISEVDHAKNRRVNFVPLY